MFGIDKAIDEFNKERLYGKKPKVPNKLEKQPIIVEYTDGTKELHGYREPNYKELKDTVNEIIEYLEWLDK